MNRKSALLAAALAAVVLACAAFLLWQHLHAQDAVTALIYQDGQLVEEIRLDQVTQQDTISLTGANGAENVVEVAPGRIRIQSANCPDQVCVHQGWISDSTVPIVCLPHQIIIEVTGGDSYADAAAG